jgi:hypothetical protein
MLPQSQLVLLVILIILALVLLNWEASNNLPAWDDSFEDTSPTEPGRNSQDRNQAAS